MQSLVCRVSIGLATALLALWPILASGQHNNLHRCGHIQDLLAGWWMQAQDLPTRDVVSVVYQYDAGHMRIRLGRYTAQDAFVPHATLVESSYHIDNREVPKTIRFGVSFLGHAIGAVVAIHRLDFDVFEIEKASGQHVRFERVPNAVVEGIGLIGSSGFIEKMTHAVQLLREKAPLYLEFVKHYVRRIQHYCPSGAGVTHPIPVVHLSEKILRQPTEIIASVLVHEAVHFQQFETRKSHSINKRLSSFEWDVRAEYEAIQDQIGVLYLLNPSSSYLSVLKKHKGTHCDQDGDGDCDWRDYYRRGY